MTLTNKEKQLFLISQGLLDPPADGAWGAQSKLALDDFIKLAGIEALLGQKDAIALNLDDDFASRIIKYMLRANHFVSRGKGRYNIVYVEGVGADGKVNDDRADAWNDRRTVIEIPENGKPIFRLNVAGTTEPGLYYTNHPLNVQGAFRIAFGQYKAWQVGIHGNAEPHEALVQRGEIKGHRDRNKDGMRSGDPIVTGSGYGVNQHWGGDAATVGRWSAGCLVGRSRNEHKFFMRLCKEDKRYLVNPNYTFISTIIAGDKLATL